MAYDEHNPHKGEIYSYEGGPNVYSEVKGFIDYTGIDNNPINLFKVLLGEDMTGIGSGKTLKNMTENDNLFIVNMNHGETGMLFYFYPNNITVSDEYIYMWGADIVSTIKKMQEKKMFKNLVWFMCSCYSGSNFDQQFEEDGNVFIMTSAPRSSSALACGFSKELGTQINCCFHMNWQRYLRDNIGHLKEKTFMDQFLSSYNQKANIGAQTVEEYCIYGNKKFSEQQNIAIFEGNLQQPNKNSFKSRELKVINSAVSMSDVRKQKGHFKKRPSPFPSETQLTYDGFDANYQNCYSENKLDLSCTKEVYKTVFSSKNPKLIQCSQTDPVLDFVKNACSEGVKITPDEIITIMKEYPCGD